MGVAFSSLDRLPLFAGLAIGTRKRLLELGVERTFPPRAVIFRAGAAPPGIYVVLSGEIRVVRSRNGRQYVVHRELPGGTLAEIPFFTGGRLPATAIALERTRCLVLPAASLRAAMHDDPALAWLFLRRLAGRVRDLVERLDNTATQSIQSRMAAILLLRANPDTPSSAFTLGVTQGELAEELATVREVVVRTLGQLRSKGIIRSAGRGRYAIADWKALRTLAQLEEHR